MNSDQKEKLSRQNDMGIVACAIRLKAARLSVELDQTDIALALGLKRTTNISNMEKAHSYPNREIMSYFWREHRIDFNFLMAGHYAQLPGDVQDRIFPKLADVSSEWDQK